MYRSSLLHLVTTGMIASFAVAEFEGPGTAALSRGLVTAFIAAAAVPAVISKPIVDVGKSFEPPSTKNSKIKTREPAKKSKKAKAVVGVRAILDADEQSAGEEQDLVTRTLGSFNKRSIGKVDHAVAAARNAAVEGKHGGEDE